MIRAFTPVWGVILSPKLKKEAQTLPTHRVMNKTAFILKSTCLGVVSVNELPGQRQQGPAQLLIRSHRGANEWH